MATAKKIAPKTTKMAHAATTIITDMQKAHGRKKSTPVERAPAPKRGRPKKGEVRPKVAKDARAVARAKGNPVPTITREERREADLALGAKLVTAARAKNGVSAAEFMASTGAAKSTVARVVRNALASGSVRKEGSTKRARYFAEKK